MSTIAKGCEINGVFFSLHCHLDSFIGTNRCLFCL